ncbi:MAG: BatD family protein [Proteobacteria bacterium]|nr:BatD family protein [Pseudomonadota bacterium]
MKKPTLLLSLLIAAAAQNPVWGDSVEELQSARHLEISSELIPADGIVPGQRVELAITIATDRWFTGGTRLEIPEVPGLVILQTNNFASNSSENRNGQSWVVQRWTLDVFPQRHGNFTIGPLTASVKISGEDASTLEGELYSPKLTFRTAVPESLSRAEHWVAAPMYKVSQSFDKDLDTLKTGDAFQREVVFEASDVMAMMLPAFNVEKLDGLTAYPQPSKLTNSSNRGTMIARRVEQISYIVEAQGRYQLPARDYFWWDTRSAQLQMRFLPAVDIHIGGGQASDQPATSGSQLEPLQILKYALGAAFIGAILWLFYRRIPRIPIAAIVAPLGTALRKLNQMRKPALPSRLNPDSSAGE